MSSRRRQCAGCQKSHFRFVCSQCHRSYIEKQQNDMKSYVEEIKSLLEMTRPLLSAHERSSLLEMEVRKKREAIARMKEDIDRTRTEIYSSQKVIKSEQHDVRSKRKLLLEALRVLKIHRHNFGRKKIVSAPVFVKKESKNEVKEEIHGNGSMNENSSGIQVLEEYVARPLEPTASLSFPSGELSMRSVDEHVETTFVRSRMEELVLLRKGTRLLRNNLLEKLKSDFEEMRKLKFLRWRGTDSIVILNEHEYDMKENPNSSKKIEFTACVDLVLLYLQVCSLRWRSRTPFRIIMGPRGHSVLHGTSLSAYPLHPQSSTSRGLSFAVSLLNANVCQLLCHMRKFPSLTREVVDSSSNSWDPKRFFMFLSNLSGVVSRVEVEMLCCLPRGIDSSGFWKKKKRQKEGSPFTDISASVAGSLMYRSYLKQSLAQSVYFSHHVDTEIDEKETEKETETEETKRDE